MQVTRIRFGTSADARVTVVIVGWRSAPHLGVCLASLANSLQRAPFEVVVVLNEPSPSVEAMVRRDVVGASVVVSRANLGFGAACNLAARRGRAPYLAFLNDDATVGPGWLDALLATAERRPAAGAVGSCLYHPDGRLQEAGCVVWSDGATSQIGDDLPGDTLRYVFERRVDYCSAAALVVPRDVWESVGGLDETYYPAYYEDVDFCMRVASSGRQVWLSPGARVAHLRGSSTQPLFREFLHQRNHAIFHAAWADELAGHLPRDPSNLAAEVWRAQGRPPRLLVLDPIPAPRRGGWQSAFRDLVSVASDELGYHLLVCACPVRGRDYARLAELGVQVLEGSPTEHLDGGLQVDAVLAESRTRGADIVLGRWRDGYSPPVHASLADLAAASLIRPRARAASG
jgi:GT2 family glycosyltransferase